MKYANGNVSCAGRTISRNKVQIYIDGKNPVSANWMHQVIAQAITNATPVLEEDEIKTTVYFDWEEISSRLLPGTTQPRIMNYIMKKINENHYRIY